MFSRLYKIQTIFLHGDCHSQRLLQLSHYNNLNTVTKVNKSDKSYWQSQFYRRRKSFDEKGKLKFKSLQCDWNDSHGRHWVGKGGIFTNSPNFKKSGKYVSWYGSFISLANLAVAWGRWFEGCQFDKINIKTNLFFLPWK